MITLQTKSSRTVGWIGIRRGHQARTLERLAEYLIFGVSLSTIIVIFLIFAFVTREALPIFLGQANSAVRQKAKAILPADMDKTPARQLQEYLEVTPRKFASIDKETIKTLLEVKVDAAKEIPDDKDVDVNSVSWSYLLGSHQWTGYNKPSYIWQPVSPIPKFNIIPLLAGSLKVTLIALLFGVPLALAAAIYVSQLANPKLREWLKPSVELLAGIPSVVLGFFALMVMASFFKDILHYDSRLNAFVAGLALSLAIIPVVFSISEDALTSVPRSYTQAALALGASRWKAAWQVVLPAALPGVFAAIVLGFGRAIGETMVVLLASGNATILSWNLFDSTRTITATIAAELAETVFGGHHYRVLFMIGGLLFIVAFVSNLVGDLIIHRLKHRLEGHS